MDRRRAKQLAGSNQILGESQAEREFERVLERWVQGNATYNEVVRVVPRAEPDVMVRVGREVRRVLGIA
jgi:hypothetical protein